MAFSAVNLLSMAFLCSARICSTRFIGAIGGRCTGTIGMVYPGTLFIGDSGAFLCISKKIGVKSEHCYGVLV
jgi:hypothetical protein